MFFTLLFYSIQEVIGSLDKHSHLTSLVPNDMMMMLQQLPQLLQMMTKIVRMTTTMLMTTTTYMCMYVLMPAMRRCKRMIYGLYIINIHFV